MGIYTDFGGGPYLQLHDGTMHFFWSFDYRPDDPRRNAKKQEKPGGVYYQSEADATPQRVGEGDRYRAIAVGDRIVLAYTRESEPNKAYFRVIRHGIPGPVTELTIAKDRTHNLWTEDMVLHAEGERIWFVNTLEPNRLHALKLTDLQAK